MVLQESKDLMRMFIKEHEGKITKNEVARYMISDKVPEKYRLSRVPVLDLVRSWQDSGDILVSEPKRRGKAHYLTFNHESEFNIIDRKISRIQSDLNKWISFIRSGRFKKEHAEYNAEYSLCFREDVLFMLQCLLLETTNNIPSPNRGVLLSRILNLVLRVNLSFRHNFDIKDPKGSIFGRSHNLNLVKEKYSGENTTDLDRLVDSFLSTEQDFLNGLPEIQLKP